MFQFGVRNLRRLKDLPAFEIRPITILVGRNSSGKSTYLRSLPLLRQSMITRTSSPILWYGDSVDFGSFDKSVFDSDAAKNIVFNFGIDEIHTTKHYGFDDPFPFIIRKFDFSDVKLEISIKKHNDGTRISFLSMSESSNKVKYDAVIGEDQSVTSLKIDGHEMSSIFLDEEIVISEGSVLPTAEFRPRNPSEEKLTDPLRRSPTYLSIRNELTRILKPRLDKRTTEDTLRRLETSLFTIGTVTKESIKSEFGDNTNRSWMKIINDICGADRHNNFQVIRRILLTFTFITILNAASNALRNIISSSLYIGPARARSERYYRYQDLAVSEIDPDGKNFAMFLNSLPAARIHDFSNWVKSIFGYGVTVSKESGHISINLTSDIGEVNIVDTGYGVSQILPVLGQIWWASNRPRQSVPRTMRSAFAPPIISIEQPELHLHPAHQALLADTLVRSYRPKNNDLGKNFLMHFMVETHSEALVNRLGELISDGKLEPDDVHILVFEPDESDPKATVVRVAKFDEKGFLLNWPYGFFLPRV